MGVSPPHIGVREVLDDVLTKPGFIVEDVVREPDRVGDPVGIIDILTGAARLGLRRGRPMIVKYAE